MQLTLSSGRCVEAFEGILGMSTTGDLALYEGYDGVLTEERDFSISERREIAELMIERWSSWAGLERLSR